MGDEEQNEHNLELHILTKENLPPFRFSCQKLMLYVGPGFLMSIAYLDPGNIAGDLAAGMQGNYKLIWVLMWSTL